MGPLFSLGLLTVLAGLAMGILFAIARIFLPTRAALVLALLLVVAGGVGCVLGALFQIPFMDGDPSSGRAVRQFLLLTLASGLASASGVLWAFLLWRMTQLRRAGIRPLG